MGIPDPNIDPGFRPCYLKTHQKGEISSRVFKLWKRMESCDLCPRQCHARRLDGEAGYCGASDKLVISSWSPHFGEEKPLVGTHGSGTIFFTHCSLHCVYCQNWEISHCGQGTQISTDLLADIMLNLQEQGCHNINLVTPDHYPAHTLKALDRAIKNGLRIPIIYNTSGWVPMDILSSFNEVIDIYMPDFKYWDPTQANKYSPGARSYPRITRQAILEMHRQVGVATPRMDGLIYRGLIIRHLVLPEDISGSLDIIRWVARNLPGNTYINLMSQYHPAYKAYIYPKIARHISQKEYMKVISYARKTGLTRIDSQSFPF